MSLIRRVGMPYLNLVLAIVDDVRHAIREVRDDVWNIHV